MTEPVREPGDSTPFGLERDPARVIAFGDAVIVIAITLLVLEIRPPHGTGTGSARSPARHRRKHADDA